MSKGKLIVISGASGVGKGTVLGSMRKRRKELSCSVSATARPPRRGELAAGQRRHVTLRRLDFEDHRRIMRKRQLKVDV